MNFANFRRGKKFEIWNFASLCRRVDIFKLIRFSRCLRDAWSHLFKSFSSHLHHSALTKILDFYIHDLELVTIAEQEIFLFNLRSFHTKFNLKLCTICGRAVENNKKKREHRWTLSESAFRLWAINIMHNNYFIGKLHRLTLRRGCNLRV